MKSSMLRITKQGKIVGLMSFLFFYSGYNYSVTPVKTVKIGLIDEGCGISDTLPLNLRTHKVQELLIKTDNIATAVAPYAPDGAQVLSIIGGKAHDQFSGGYAPKSELFYYGGGDLLYFNKQYQSIYQAFSKESIRLLYHGITGHFSNHTVVGNRYENLLLDLIHQNKILIIWPAGDNPDLLTSYNADIPLYRGASFEKGWLIVVGYDSPVQVLHTGSTPCGKASRFCVMAPYAMPVPYVPGAVNNIDNNFASGTKFSAAIVTGIAAQVLQKYPWMDNDILRQTLLSTAQRESLSYTTNLFGMPPAYQPYSRDLHGWGLVNLNAALKGPSLFDSDLNLNRNKNKVIVDVNDKDTDHIYTFSHDIKGNAGLDKRGKGTLELSGNNQYKGATFVKEGVLKITGSLIDDPMYYVTVHDGATLELSGTDL